MLRKKLEFIEQMEHSECGLACVTMLLRYHGRNISLENIREEFGVPKGGNNLAHLQIIFRKYGIETKGLRINDVKKLKEVVTPFICFWENKHFIVIEKIKQNKILIVDPAKGRMWIDFEEFTKLFSQLILVPVKVEIVKEKNKRKSPLKILFDMVLQKKKVVVSLLAITLIIQTIGMSIPILTQKIVDNGNLLNNKTIFFKIGIVMILVACIHYILQVFRGIVIAKFQTYFDITLMSKFMDRLVSLPIRFFLNRSTGDLIFRSNLSVYIRQILSQRMTSIIIDSIFVFVYLFLMLSYSVTLTMVTLAITFLIVVVSIINSKNIKKITDKEIIAQSKAQKTVAELIEGMETVKVTGVEDYFFGKWIENFKEQLKMTEKKGIWNAVISNISNTLQFMLSLLLVWIGVLQVQQGNLTMGQLISISGLSVTFITPVISLASSYTELLVLKSYFDRIYEILASRTEENLSKKNGITDIEEIKLSNVNFRYSEFEDMSLKNINLVIKKNEKVAIVGRSGCGKSTLLKVLSSLYIPNTGDFFINNKKITELNPREYRKNIGIINQNPDIFSGSIVENIILDGFDISKDSLYLENVIRLSDVQSIIEGLPLGIHTQISEGGANLSGGQKQKLALARALYKKPPLLIMDEPTSALDNLSEKYIMDNIKDLNMTCVVAAHRLNTIKNFDRILIMHNGEIVEEGSHDQLINQRGYYYEIYSNEIGKGKERYEEVNV